MWRTNKNRQEVYGNVINCIQIDWFGFCVLENNQNLILKLSFLEKWFFEVMKNPSNSNISIWTVAMISRWQLQQLSVGISSSAVAKQDNCWTCFEALERLGKKNGKFSMRYFFWATNGKKWSILKILWNGGLIFQLFVVEPRNNPQTDVNNSNEANE